MTKSAAELPDHCKLSDGQVIFRIKIILAVLLIRRGNNDNLGVISHISPFKNIYCDPSTEPSLRGGSNEGSQHMFSLRK